MPGFSIIPRHDEQQAQRIQRYFAGALSSLLILVYMGAVHLHGYMTLRGLLWCIGLTMAAYVGFYLLLRSGINLRFRDPTLAGAKILTAFIITTIAAYHTQNDARSVFLPALVMSFFFGTYRLETRILVFLAILCSAIYGVMLGILIVFNAEEMDIKLETLRWWILAIALLWFAVLSGQIGKQRRELADSKLAMESLLEHDELTGVGNRRYLTTVLEQEKSRSDRSGTPFCVAMLDLDFFKKVNDTYGHAAGDKVLKVFALVAQDGLRRIDYFGRYGGEEFMLIMADTTLAGATIKAERLRANIANTPHADIDPALVQTVSIGVAEYRRGETIADIQKRADKALYKAKTSGRNRVEIDA